ncbi:MAG: VanW family protein [Promicromonosporaceae bacterium]|nr:VanW family protein [Promicromonosporaceae bacterium]
MDTDTGNQPTPAISPAKGNTKALPVIVPPTAPQAGPVAIPAPPRPDAAEQQPEGKQKSKLGKRSLLAGIGLVIIAAMYFIAQWSLQDRVPTGTNVAGVYIGALSSEDAIARLADRLGERAATPVTVIAGGNAVEVIPAEAGFAFDPAVTVDGLTGFSLDPQRLWRHLVGTSEVEPRVTLNRERLDAVAAEIAAELNVVAVSGTVAFSGTEVVMTEAHEGITVEAEAVATALIDGWLAAGETPIEVVYEITQPTINAATTQAAYEEALALVAGPVIVEVGENDVTLPVSLLAQAASIRTAGSTLNVSLDGAALYDTVVVYAEGLLAEPVDARFEFVDGLPVVAGGDPGMLLDREMLGSEIQAATRTEARTAVVPLVERAPAITRESLEALNVNELVSAFSTPHTADETRTNNLRRGAQLLTGYLIMPGEIFSITDALSPITLANGFFEASVIRDGRFQRGIGGGLSQVATTTYNVGFFAGFEDIYHRPHSLFLTMYPPGREATFVVNSFDMQFRNNTPYAAVMNAWVAGGSFHVELWGTPYFRVETTASPRTNIRPAESRPWTFPEPCVPRNPGQPGFTITNTRRVFRLDNDEMVFDESNTHIYQPTHGWYCPAPAAPPAPPANPDPPAEED